MTEYTDGGNLDSNFLMLGGNVHRAVMLGVNGTSPGIQLMLETYQDITVPLLFSEDCARSLVHFIRVALRDLPEEDDDDGPDSAA